MDLILWRKLLDLPIGKRSCKSNMDINKWFQKFLKFFGGGLLGFAGFYWIQMISQDLWENTPFRIVIVLLVIGGVCCFALERILRNQSQILDELRRLRGEDGYD